MHFKAAHHYGIWMAFEKYTIKAKSLLWPLVCSKLSQPSAENIQGLKQQRDSLYLFLFREKEIPE